jgi:hypothetical protein
MSTGDVGLQRLRATVCDAWPASESALGRGEAPPCALGVSTPDAAEFGARRRPARVGRGCTGLAHPSLAAEMEAW